LPFIYYNSIAILVKQGGGGLIMNGIVPIAAGTAGGILLNDIWEGALTNGVPLPGYGQKLTVIGQTPSGDEISLGYDDLYQIGVGVAAILTGHFTFGSFVRNIGIGMIGGWALTKAGEFQPGVRTTDAAGEYFRNPISLIPHRYPPIPSGSSAVVTTSNAVSSKGAFFVNVP
jgi:hypothetical protein